jgi:hypothetical protein
MTEAAAGQHLTHGCASNDNEIGAACSGLLLVCVVPCFCTDISGTVPVSLREMRQLLQLDLEINKLTGSLNEGQLCDPAGNDLKLLLIR